MPKFDTFDDDVKVATKTFTTLPEAVEDFQRNIFDNSGNFELKDNTGKIISSVCNPTFD